MNEQSHCSDVFDSTWSKLDLSVIFIDLFFSTSKFRTLRPFRLELKGFERKAWLWKWNEAAADLEVSPKKKQRQNEGTLFGSPWMQPLY